MMSLAKKKKRKKDIIAKFQTERYRLDRRPETRRGIAQKSFRLYPTLDDAAPTISAPLFPSSVDFGILTLLRKK